MLMSIHWGHECTFVFDYLSTDSWLFYIIGCFLSGMVATLTIATPAIKRKIVKKQNLRATEIVQGVRSGKQDGNIMLAFSYYLIYTSLHVLSMMLVMTYNGGVICTMIVFSAIGYFMFGPEDSDSDLPVNCCAGTS